MNTNEKAWIVAGLFGLVLAACVMPDADERKQPRSEGSGLFSPNEPVMDPLNSGRIMRQNQQQSGV